MSVARGGNVELVHVSDQTVTFNCEGVESTGAILGRTKLGESGRHIVGLLPPSRFLVSTKTTLSSW